MNSSALDLGLISKDINLGSIDTDSLFSCVGAAITCVNENEGNNNVITNNGTVPPPGEPDGLTVFKEVECEESPADGDVCAFVVTSANFPDSSDYQIHVTGNGPAPADFNGQSTGTLVDISPGNYVVSEGLASTGALQAELQGPNTSIITSTTATGDCIPNFNVNNIFADATGTMTSGDS